MGKYNICADLLTQKFVLIVKSQETLANTKPDRQQYIPYTTALVSLFIRHVITIPSLNAYFYLEKNLILQENYL